MTERLQRFRALAHKEFLATVKEKTSRMILIGPLVLYIVLFGYIASFNLDRVPYALCDLSKSALSTQFIQAIDHNRIFQRVGTYNSLAQVPQAVDEANALLVIVIPENFVDTVYEKKSATIQVIIDGRNSTTAQLAAGYLGVIAEAFNARVLGLESFLTPRLLYNPNSITQWFIMPGLIAMLSMLQVLILSALSVAREREQGTFEQLLVSPYQTIDLLLAKAYIPMVIGLFQGTLIFLVDLWWFDIPMAGSIWVLYFALLIFMTSIVGLGLAISAYSETMQQGLLLVFVFMVPMVLLSGLFAPVQNMPEWLQLLTYADPLRFALTTIRRVYLIGIGFTEVIVGLWPVILMSLVTLPLAYYFFKKRL